MAPASTPAPAPAPPPASPLASPFSAMASLLLPLPAELPDDVALVGARLGDVRRDFPAAFAAATGFAATPSARALLGWAGEHLGQGLLVDAEPPSGSCVHDRFFGVRRATGDGAALLAAALVTSDVLVRDDLDRNGSTLAEDPDDLLLGVTAFLTRELPAPRKHVVWEPDDQDAAAQERWLVGHQRFFVMMQLLVVALGQLARPAASAEEEADAVRTFGWLCRSAAVSMRYAADFPPELYGGVRATMTPPDVNAGFSGLQTRDHHALVTLMRQAGRDGVFDRLDPASVAAVQAAVQSMYEAHGWVCSRFGGAVEPSLLMAQAAQAAGSPPPESGLAAAERLARQRMGYLKPRASS
ncbi:hypothetical protein ABT160_20130 [Streptomyces sp. NPDC001941]|uniref:hypothetical protein n=1 Tax=Streptomyces sp. NPDC001941 TaxID=3154659 RepID=UPI00332C88D8